MTYIPVNSDQSEVDVYFARVCATILVLFAVASCDSVDETVPLEEVTAQSEATLSKGGGEKVDLCHRTKGKEPRQLINVSVNAVEAHLAHGDGRPGNPVPEMEGYQFDGECNPVEACPCFSAQDVVDFEVDGRCYLQHQPRGPGPITNLWCESLIPVDRAFGVQRHTTGIWMCWNPLWSLPLLNIGPEAAATCVQSLRIGGERLGLEECRWVGRDPPPAEPVCHK